ncbi:MAG: 50S ribosomal protein L22 [Deltaproteobacteria bacterium]|nr:50S ribosomal protein L22 [Deltaproteobacteria bacterium]RLB91733.1 MAG: 50S ribosomal protein L22 [Deltaproteobacteria bacterium]RLB96714.1 MAG: 50S ribosomal protein L22 [Deltaproteobacteria bacterium]RLC12849.1 MAG: 50S ribosomal protein L22 [Deltaproteobacteria bacterium]
METRAIAKYVRISPTKVRKVAEAIKGKSVEDALSVLGFVPQRPARILGKVIRSALANAEQMGNIDVDDLSISRIVVDEGPSLKRFRPRAMGRAGRIIKRTSHITVTLAEKENKGK